MKTDQAAGKWVVPLPTRVEPVRGVRGTFIVASRAQIRAFGRFEAYERALSPGDRSSLEAVIAASWVPMELAHAHFQSIETLGILESEVLEGAKSVSDKLHGVFLGTLVKTVRLAGITPWTGFTMAAKLWPRIFNGGALGVQEAGPKEARIVMSGNPLFRYAYHRVAVRGHVRLTTQVFVKIAHVREESCDPERGVLSLVASWV